jgi:arginyl-tRNA synthetase
MGDRFREQVEKMVGSNNLEEPPRAELGDLSFPCFESAKVEGRSPVVVAKDLADKLVLPREHPQGLPHRPRKNNLSW